MTTQTATIQRAADILNGTARQNGVTYYDDGTCRWYAAKVDALPRLIELHAADASTGYSLWCAEQTVGDGNLMEDRAAKELINTIDVLCDCGWGQLAVPNDDLPVDCPICGHRFMYATQPDD